jgi:hypothetical protein
MARTLVPAAAQAAMFHAMFHVLGTPAGGETHGGSSSM